MSKIASVATAITGTAAASVGGVYLVQKMLSSHGPDVLEFKTLVDFKNKKGGSCAQKYFGELDYEDKDKSNSKAIGTNNTFNSTTDFPGTVASGTNPQSCLIINWEKIKSTSQSGDTKDKGTGNFRFLGALANGDKGFVMFYTTKPSDTDNQLDLEGGIYFLSKESGENKPGQLSKYKEFEASKNLSKSSFDNAFLPVGDNLDGIKSAEKPNGGFVANKDDLDNVCKKNKSNCPKDPDKKQEEPFKGLGNGQVDTSASNTVDKGTKEFSTKFTHLLGTDHSLSMTNSFDNFKGSGKKFDPAKTE